MRDIRYLGCFLIIFPFLAGCSGQEIIELPPHLEDLPDVSAYSPDVQPQHNISFEKDREFGDTGEVFFERMTDAAVDDDGRVFIADLGQMNIKIFEPDGSHVTNLGRSGRGPGEFQHISDLQVANNRLYVWDGTFRKSAIFSLDSLSHMNDVSLGRDRSSYQELLESQPGRYYAKSDGGFLQEFMSVTEVQELVEPWYRTERTGTYFMLDETGRITSDQIFEMLSSIGLTYQVQGMSMSSPPDFFEESLVALDTQDNIYTAMTDEFLLKVYGPEGAYQRAIYYPIERIPLTLESAIESEGPEMFHSAIEMVELPEFWPVLNSMMIDDDNRIWISTYVEDIEMYEWWVLQNDGELLATFDWPRTQPIQTIRNGFLYARETDEETGIQQIARYAIHLN